MILLLILLVVVLVCFRGNPFPAAGYAFSPLDVIVLILFVLILAAALGGLGPYSRWPL